MLNLKKWLVGSLLSLIISVNSWLDFTMALSLFVVEFILLSVGIEDAGLGSLNNII